MQTLIRPMTHEYAPYLRDESRRVGKAESICFARTEEEIQRVLAACRRDGIRVTVQGARTGLAGAASPEGGLILNLQRMDGVLGCRYDGERFYLRVQPGVVLAELKKMIARRSFDTRGWSKASLDALQALARAKEQFFPPDPTETTATLGGMAACNASGARSYLYGAMRGHVHALRLVLMDGRILPLERGVHRAQVRTLTLTPQGGEPIRAVLPSYQMPKTKNTSAYFAADDMDAVDLIIGSDGTLGVISELEIALSPLPAHIAGAMCLLTAHEQCVDFVVRLRARDEGVASVEYFDGHALDVLRRQRQTHAGFKSLPEIAHNIAAAVYVEFHHAHEDALTPRLIDLADMLKAAGADAENTWVARNPSDLERMLYLRHAVPESVNLLIDERKKHNSAITKLGSDMAVPDEHLRTIMDYYAKSVQDQGLQSATWGHIGDNHLHVNILPNSMEEYERGKALFMAFARTVASLSGSVSAEHGVGKLKADFLNAMYTPRHIEQMRELKAQFDPGGLLGAGNLFSPKDQEGAL